MSILPSLASVRRIGPYCSAMSTAFAHAAHLGSKPFEQRGTSSSPHGPGGAIFRTRSPISVAMAPSAEVCLGTMTWGMQNNEADAHEQLDYAIKERGVNFIDTAGTSSLWKLLINVATCYADSLTSQDTLRIVSRSARWT